MNCFNVKLYGYCNKLLNLYNYILTDSLIWVILNKNM